MDKYNFFYGLPVTADCKTVPLQEGVGDKEFPLPAAINQTTLSGQWK